MVYSGPKLSCISISQAVNSGSGPTLQQPAEGALADVPRQPELPQVHRHPAEPVHPPRQSSCPVLAVQLETSGGARKDTKTRSSAADPSPRRRQKPGSQGTSSHVFKAASFIVLLPTGVHRVLLYAVT